MATYIPGDAERQAISEGTTHIPRSEVIAIVGTIACTVASAAILLWRLLQIP